MTRRAAASARAASARASSAEGAALADGGTRLVWAALAALAAARALASLSSSMTWWGIDVQRFLPFAWGWLPWALVGVALVPAVGRAATPLLSRLGDALASPSVRVTLAAAIASAAIVKLLPDRTLFLGDFAMRSGTIMLGKDPSQLFPQAMPLDVLVQIRLPAALGSLAHWPVEDSLRWLGALGAALLGVAAVLLTRALDLRGAAALAAAAVLWGGGYLGMFTGYGKTAIELTVLTALAGVFALRAARDGGGVVWLGACCALALGFHRSGVLLLPVAITAFALAPGGWRAPTRWVGMALVAAGLVLFGPRIAHLLATFDVKHHLAPASAGGPWAGVIQPTHLLDVLNVALVLSPLAPAIPAFAPAFSRAGSREKLVLAALVLPALAMMLITRPQQGVFRDRDVFAQAGVALSLLAAWGAGRTLAASRARAWLAPALALSTIVPSAHWLAIMHQPDDALRYVHAYITGPPTRTADDRAATYDFIGVRALVTQRYDEAAAAYAKAVEAAPNPRLYATWGVCDIMAGRYPRAESLYRCAVSRDPNFLTGWVGLGTSASWVGDTTTCAEAERQITRLDPGNAQLADLRAYLARVRGAH